VRIALVTHQFFPAFYTGVERLALNLARQLQRMGHQPVVVTSAPHSSGSSAPYAVEGVPVRPVETVRTELARPWLYDRGVGTALGRVLDEERVELVHVMNPVRVSAAFGQAHARGLPVVAHVADFGYMCARLNLLRAAGELCLGPEGGQACVEACRISAGPKRYAWGVDLVGSAAAVVSPSRVAIELHARSGFDTAHWHHVPWGVDYGLHRRRLPAPERSGLTVGFIGTLLAHKGPHVLVEALRLLGDRDVRLVLHGGSFHEVRYQAELRSAAAGDARIVFAGAYAHEWLPEVLAPLDAVAIPSLWHENLPTSGLNAVASGVPLLASDVAGLRELVEDYDCGVTFPPGDARALAALLARLHDDGAELARIRERMAYPPSLEEEAWRIELLYTAAERASGAIPPLAAASRRG
jgi:glycosyltransferase involved in cell wall biosynthesis